MQQVGTANIHSAAEALSILRTNGVEIQDCIDGGASTGVIANSICHLLHEDALIYAFEPFEGNWPYFAVKDSRIKLVKKALYKSSARKKFFVSQTLQTNNKWSNGDMRGYSSLGYIVEKSNHEPQKIYDVECVSADEYVRDTKNITFVKLDIQGGELNALMGMKQIINSVTCMWIEYTGQYALLDFLLINGFVCFDTSIFFVTKDIHSFGKEFTVQAQGELSTGSSVVTVARKQKWLGDYRKCLLEYRKKIGPCWTDLLCVPKDKVSLLGEHVEW